MKDFILSETFHNSSFKMQRFMNCNENVIVFNEQLYIPSRDSARSAGGVLSWRTKLTHHF